MSKLTKSDIEKVITGKKFFCDELLTICVLTLHDTFKVIGESACIDPKEYNRELGEKNAYNVAFEKIWELESYRIKTQKPQPEIDWAKLFPPIDTSPMKLPPTPMFPNPMTRPYTYPDPYQPTYPGGKGFNDFTYCVNGVGTTGQLASISMENVEIPNIGCAILGTGTMSLTTDPQELKVITHNEDPNLYI